MSKTQKPNKGGRPPVDTEAITLRLPRATIEKIEEVRRQFSSIPTKQTVIRFMIEDWIERRGNLKED